MEASTTLATGRTRRPLSALGLLTAASAAGIGFALIYLQAAMIGMLIPPLAAFAVISFVVAGVVALGWRWAPALGALWALVVVAGNSAEVAYSLTHPTEVRGFGFMLVSLALATVGLVAGVAATAQNYRGGVGPSMRAVMPGLTLLVGLIGGALGVAVLAASGVNAGVSPETLASLPAVTTVDFTFDQPEIRVRAGETVALRLENHDSEGHSFDIDEFAVHALMPSGETSLALFQPTKPGSYTFYCAPHYDKATGQGMKGTLIVE